MLQVFGSGLTSQDVTEVVESAEVKNIKAGEAIITEGEQGRFGEGGIAPGGYSVLAFDDLNGLEYSNPDVLRPYLPKAVHVNLQPNRETTVELEPIGREE